MIRPLKEADVDIFVVLDAKYYNQANPRGVLDRVKKAFVDHYGQQGVAISRNGQAVTLTYSDFKVDVVPAFNRTGGGYLIPNSGNQTWIGTEPKSHVKIWSDTNTNKDGRFVPVLKMLKRWKAVKSDSIRSFHLETLALTIFSPVEMHNWRGSVRYFFDRARTNILYNIPDPAPGFNGFVDSYLTYNQKQALVSPIESAYGRAVKAQEYEDNDKHKDAIDQWRLVFGDYFPAYG